MILPLLAYIIFDVHFLVKNNFVENIDEELVNPTDKRIFAISTALHQGYSVDKICQMTNIDKWFLTKLEHIYTMEKHLMCVTDVLLHYRLLISCSGC